MRAINLGEDRSKAQRWTGAGDGRNEVETMVDTNNVAEELTAYGNQRVGTVTTGEWMAQGGMVRTKTKGEKTEDAKTRTRSD
jgi:hypothetical protein